MEKRMETRDYTETRQNGAPQVRNPKHGIESVVDIVYDLMIVLAPHGIQSMELKGGGGPPNV